MEKLMLPIKITDLSPKLPPTGAPICERVDPTTLYVDHSYQRQVSERGRKQIRKVVEQFCWTKFKPPIGAYAVNESGATVLKVLDGQHIAIAAASNPHVGMIPGMIVDAPDVARHKWAACTLGVAPLLARVRCLRSVLWN